MVFIDIIEFTAINRVKLDSYDMVAGFAIVGFIEKAEVLARKSSREGSGWGDNEDDAVAAEIWILGDDGEDKGGGEGERRRVW